MVGNTIPELNILLVGADAGEKNNGESVVSVGTGSTARMALYCVPEASKLNEQALNRHSPALPANMMASVVCFDTHDIQSYSQAVQTIKTLRNANHAKLLPVPIFLVGVTTTMQQDKHLAVQKTDICELVDANKLAGYYEVSTGVFKTIIDNPQGFADGNLFSTMNTGEAKNFNLEIKKASLEHQHRLSRLTDALMKPFTLLHNIELPENKKFSQLRESFASICKEYQQLKGIVNETCLQSALLKHLYQMQNQVDTFEETLKQWKEDMPRSSSIFKKSVEATQLTAAHKAIAQFSQSLTELFKIVGQHPSHLIDHHHTAGSMRAAP